MPNLHDKKRIIVTGGGSGIGRATVLSLASQGHLVGIIDIEGERVRKVYDEMGGEKDDAMQLIGDVSQKDEVEEMFSRVDKAWGDLDVLINCAGISYRRDPLELTEEEWDRLMAINLKGTFLCSQAVLPSMVKQKKGRIVNMASSLGFTGSFLMAHYAASKGGVIALTKSLALGMARFGITVNAVAPGAVDTPLVTRTPEWTQQLIQKIPLGRIAVPEDIVGAILFLAIGQSEYITGQTIYVNGGNFMI
jgi:NAD(P)-dependent dehydrogenase (short-subunit alcohol dehydrogenase family)